MPQAERAGDWCGERDAEAAGGPAAAVVAALGAEALELDRPQLVRADAFGQRLDLTLRQLGAARA